MRRLHPASFPQAPVPLSHGLRFGTDFPARTTLVVGFAHPDVRVEIEAIAYVGEGRS